MRPLLPPRKQASKVVEKRGGKGSFSSSSDQKLPSLLATSSVLPPSLLPKPNHATACDAGKRRRRRRRRRRRKGGPFPGHKSRNLLPPLASLSPSPFSPPAQPPLPPPPPSLHHHQVNRVCHSTQGGRKERGRRKKLIGYASSPTFSTLQLLADFIRYVLQKKKAWINLVCFLQTCGTKIFIFASILGECWTKKIFPAKLYKAQEGSKGRVESEKGTVFR